MANDGIRRAAVIGTGQMGPGIALCAALADCGAVLIGRSAESLRAGRARFAAALAFLVETEVVSPREADAASARLETSTELAAAAGCDIVVESVPEHLATKQELFRLLDELCAPPVILASNTSGLRISEVAASLRHPERALTAHFWNPAHLMPLVDVMKGERTAERTIERTCAFLRRCGKRPVVGRRDVPGQIGNRLQHAVIREAIYMVAEGIASAEDVETALAAGAGLRYPVYGPLEHLDAIGLDMALSIQRSIFPSLCAAGEPDGLIEGLVASGRTGAAAGRGFHDWSARSVDELRGRRDRWLAERLKDARRSGRPGATA